MAKEKEPSLLPFFVILNVCRIFITKIQQMSIFIHFFWINSIFIYKFALIKQKIMAKILGISIAIFSGLALLGQLFLYQNSSAYFTYNPADKVQGLADTGLILPLVMTSIFFVIGVLLFKVSNEPENF